MFKEKLASDPLNPVEVSISWTYSLSSGTNPDWNNWPQQPPDFESMGGVVGNSSFHQFGFGAIKDPVKYVVDVIRFSSCVVIDIISFFKKGIESICNLDWIE